MVTSVTDEGEEQHTQRQGNGGGWTDRRRTEWSVNLRGGSALASVNFALTSDGLVASVAPLPADEIRQEHDEDEGC